MTDPSTANATACQFLGIQQIKAGNIEVWPDLSDPRQLADAKTILIARGYWLVAVPILRAGRLIRFEAIVCRLEDIYSPGSNLPPRIEAVGYSGQGATEAEASIRALEACGP